MNVNIILLDYDRHDFTEEVKEQNFSNADHPFDYTVIDMKGISAAFNKGIEQSRQYDAVVFMANDILLPGGWLRKMVEAAAAIPETGVSAIAFDDEHTQVSIINGVDVIPTTLLISDLFIPMKVINRIGLFNEILDPYGPCDLDFTYRAKMAGFINYYLVGLRAKHYGYDTGSEEYKKMKWDSMNIKYKEWEEQRRQYDSGKPIIIFR